jgi:hypothetical protein
MFLAKYLEIRDPTIDSGSEKAPIVAIKICRLFFEVYHYFIAAYLTLDSVKHLPEFVPALAMDTKHK